MLTRTTKYFAILKQILKLFKMNCFEYCCFPFAYQYAGTRSKNFKSHWHENMALQYTADWSKFHAPLQYIDNLFKNC